MFADIDLRRLAEMTAPERAFLSVYLAGLRSAGELEKGFHCRGSTLQFYRERMKRSFGIDPLMCPRCGQEMGFEGIWHPQYGWIIDNWDSFFITDMPEGEGDGARGRVGSDVRCAESVVQLQMCFM